MIYRRTSIKPVLTKLFREFKSFPIELRGDAIEWIGEAIEAMGMVGAIVENKRFDGTTEGHIAELPCDIMKLNMVISNGVEYKYGSGHFMGDPSDGDRTHTFHKRKRFKIEGNYFKSYEESVDFSLDYEGIAIDEDGLPEIPDNYYVREAVVSYVVYKAIESGISHPVLKYEAAYMKWELMLNKAKKKLKMPDKPRMIGMINSMKRLIPHISPSSQLFENYNDPETMQF